MPNIYLRVSKYVAAFMRAIGDGQSRDKTDPIVFSEYTQEFVVLVNGLRLIPAANQHRASCYSQSAWQNMSRGILPQGGMAVIKRDPQEYLSYSEICTLERLPNKTKTDAYEFICIALPREVCINGKVIRTNKAYTLDSQAAQQLRRLLRNSFIRTYLDFETRSRLFAQSNNIERSGVEIIERFFMEYDVPVSHEQTERDTLRRLARRWRKEAEYLVKSPTIIKDELITRIDEHEMRGGLPSYD